MAEFPFIEEAKKRRTAPFNEDAPLYEPSPEPPTRQPKKFSELGFWEKVEEGFEVAGAAIFTAGKLFSSMPDYIRYGAQGEELEATEVTAAKAKKRGEYYASLREAGQEQLVKELQREDADAAWARFQIGGDIREEFHRLPEWQKLLYETPGFFALPTGRVAPAWSALSAIAKNPTRSLFMKLGAQVGQITLTPVWLIEKAVGFLAKNLIARPLSFVFNKILSGKIPSITPAKIMAETSDILWNGMSKKEQAEFLVQLKGKNILGLAGKKVKWDKLNQATQKSITKQFAEFKTAMTEARVTARLTQSKDFQNTSLGVSKPRKVGATEVDVFPIIKEGKEVGFVRYTIHPALPDTPNSKSVLLIHEINFLGRGAGYTGRAKPPSDASALTGSAFAKIDAELDRIAAKLGLDQIVVEPRGVDVATYLKFGYKLYENAVIRTAGKSKFAEAAKILEKLAEKGTKLPKEIPAAEMPILDGEKLSEMQVAMLGNKKTGDALKTALSKWEKTRGLRGKELKKARDAMTSTEKAMVEHFLNPPITEELPRPVLDLLDLTSGKLSDLATKRNDVWTRWKNAVARGSSGKRLLAELEQLDEVLATTWSKIYEEKYGFQMSESSLRPLVDKYTANFIGILKDTRKALKSIEKLNKETLKKMAAQLHGDIREHGAEAALRAAGGTRAQELRVAEYPPIRGEVTGDMLVTMFEYIKVTDKIPSKLIHNRFNTIAALRDLASGFHLQRNQIKFLSDVFGSDFGKALAESQMTRWGKFGEFIFDLINLPKSIRASMDFSFMLRQGYMFFVSEPASSIKSTRAMFKAVFKPKNFNEMQTNLARSQYYDLAQESGLEIVDILSPFASMVEREEFFASHMAENLFGGKTIVSKFADATTAIGKLAKGVGHVLDVPSKGIRASERAFVAYGNQLRMDIFNKYVEQLIKGGYDVYGKDISAVRALSKTINFATGRGSLGSSGEGTIRALNAVFFAPRLVVSRFQFPLMMFNSNPVVRKMAMKSMATFIGTNVTLMKTGEAFGVWQVDFDPRSTNFGKIRIGNVHLDLWAGYAPLVKMFAQMFLARKTSSGRLQDTIPWEIFQKAIWSKFSPVAGTIRAIAGEQTFLGDELVTREQILGEVGEQFIPLFFADLEEVFEMEEFDGMWKATPGIFGAGVTAFDTNDQLVSEVYYNLTKYQNLHLKLREYIEMEEQDNIEDIVKSNPEAQFIWDEGRGTVFSNTYRMLSKYSSDLDKLRRSRDTLTKTMDLLIKKGHDKKDIQAMITKYDQQMFEIAIQAMLELDKVQAEYNKK